ncbi:MAG: oxygenase MpaB family protein [Salinisphaera sp.]|nr:oxygenase MpaB family protein [Salinisphaera sp.]
MQARSARPAGNPLLARLRRAIIGVVATSEDFGIDYDAPTGDPGLFGPGSVTWKMHADFPAMMSGGIAALMLQMLHPRALAGVVNHSGYRSDPLGRLRRTTMFVAATTYAPTADAHRLIARVQRIHDRVHGTTDDGEPYSARDPDLLRWVHCTEMASFLAGYQRYRQPRLSIAIQDQYFAETRRIAEALGATDLPASRAQMDAYFAAMQPALRFDDRTRDTLAVLESMALPIPAAGFARRSFLGAGAVLLPHWARRLIPRTRRQRIIDQAAAQGLKRIAPLIRASMAEGVAMRSARRAGATGAALTFDSQA